MKKVFCEMICIVRNIVVFISLIFIMSVSMSCSTREGDDSVVIKDGLGEILLKYDECSGGYWIFLTPVGFEVIKNSDNKEAISIEVENRSEDKLIVFWGGPLLSERNDRNTGSFELEHVGSKQAQSFVDVPDRIRTGKSYLHIGGYKKPLNLILRLRFAIPFNGSVQIHHEPVGP